MALFLKQNEERRSALQDKVAAQLQERAKNGFSDKKAASPPDPAFLDNQHTTRPIGVILVIVALVAIGLTVWIVRP